MSKALHQQQEHKVLTPLERFLAINEARLKRLQLSVSKRKAAFMQALPVLFHLNDSTLPGYISDKTPVGIKDYTPANGALLEARRIAKNRHIGRRTPRKFDILGLYFMGSPGTIAYNGESDFDIWLFIDSDVTEERLGELQRKCDLIEKWAKHQNIEVHFFIIDPDRFRSGETVPVSSESSGSAQYGLLLDEFYRSSIKVAGLSLAWWMVPAKDEAHYDALLSSQQHLDDWKPDQFINLGGLTHIAPEEFFGAAIWQLNKSFNSPYKSMMKLLLMEVYAHDPTGASLLSHRFKKQVYAGVSDVIKLDPWLQILDQAEEYLVEQHDGQRLNMLRRSFYLKIGEKISETHHIETWKRNLIRKRIECWGWDEEQISELDRRENWKLETVIRERADLISTLTKSYRFLSRYARHQAGNPHITEGDLNILGRRLFAAFERKSGKIEIINRGIAPDIREGTVSLHNLKSTGGAASWVLYRGIIKPQDLGDSTHLKRTANLIEMLAWCYFNQILDAESQIMLYLPADCSVNQREIKTILESFHKQFPLHELEVTTASLSQPVRLKTAALFVNTGLKPKTDPFLADTHLSSQRSNALSYGGRHENLTITFDMVFVTSWGETIIHHYAGPDALIDCVTEYISWAPVSQKQAPGSLRVYCYSPGYGAQIRKTLNTLFDDIIAHFYTESGSGHGRYILEIENGYQTLEINNDVISHQRIPDKSALLEYLAEPQQQFVPVNFGPYACKETVLPAIYTINKADILQLFFYLKDNSAKIYVLDEKGSLFYDQVTFNNKHSLFGQYKIFSETIIDRIGHDNMSALFNDAHYQTEMYLIKNDNVRGFEIESLLVLMDRSDHFLSLQVLCDQDDNQVEQLTIFCENREYSSLEFGADLFNQVARQVMKFRGSRQTYPVHITDIDLAPALLADKDASQLQSVQLFKYKKTIEAQLTEALHKL